MTEHIERLTAALADQYRFEGEIGAGGMATVYRMEDVKHGRKVAIKVLRPELAAVIGGERFLREIEIVARLRHPHIVPLHDSGAADGFLYYVMPYVEGESLRAFLGREKQLGIPQAVEIAQEVADALAYAHARGVVHRDIKPENIMLDSGHAIVMDFGVAFVNDALTPQRLTERGSSPGTPQYMSPEQASGEHEPDGRSDIYSLGCVLYEMLAGDPPFTGTTTHGVLARKLVEPVPSIRVVRETVGDALEWVTHKALARVPADRFRTALEFKEALTAASIDQRNGSAEHRMPTRPTGWPPLPSPTLTFDSQTSPGQDAPFSLPRVLGVVTAYLMVAAVFVSIIGLLTTRAFDIKLQMPPAFTPSQNFITAGVQALVPFAAVAFIVLWVYVLSRLGLRLVALALRRLPGVRQRADSTLKRVHDRWYGFWGSVEAGATAEIFFMAAIVVSVVVLVFFWRLLSALITTDVEVLSCASRPYHRWYLFAMPVLITGLLLAWYGVFRYLKARVDRSYRVAIARWGSVAWILILAVIMTLPWQLLYGNNLKERVLVEGDQAYVLVETDTHLVLYKPAERLTEQYRKAEAPDIERRAIMGYLFEGPEAFESSSAGC